MIFEIQSVGVVQSPFIDKFGIPRQPELVPAAHTIIILNTDFAPESVRGLADFDYIWVQFVFHKAMVEGWSQMVRPPRLGGKKKMGIFATRSPHRPNHIGLSLLRLLAVEDACVPIKLVCAGGDLLNGTPVLDIKPYLPFVEAKPEALSGFVQGMPPKLAIIWQTDYSGLSDNTRSIIEQCLAQDPRPAYQNLPERIYGMRVVNVEVKFRVIQQKVFILHVEKLL